MISLTCKYGHSLGKLEMLGGLTDDVLVDRLTGRQVDRLTADRSTNQNVPCLGKLEMLCGLTDGVLVDMSTG